MIHYMTWVLAVLVVYLVASVWLLRRSLRVESNVMRANLLLLWRRVRHAAAAMPASEIYQELRLLDVRENDARHFSGWNADTSADDDDLWDEEGSGLVALKGARETARSYYTDMARCDYLQNQAEKAWADQYALWRMRYARAVLERDRLEREEEKQLQSLSGRNGHNDPWDAFRSLAPEEQENLHDDWNRKRKEWDQRYPDAARAHDEMYTKAHRDLNEYMVIRDMPDMVEARKRDLEQIEKGEKQQHDTSRKS